MKILTRKLFLIMIQCFHMKSTTSNAANSRETAVKVAKKGISQGHAGVPLTNGSEPPVEFPLALLPRPPKHKQPELAEPRLNTIRSSLSRSLQHLS
uniref:Putative secreted protein n=1 Tax=Panstrongylus lignarius TaxID=156445 RepID=A0A224XR69_9HEMI